MSEHTILKLPFSGKIFEMYGNSNDKSTFGPMRDNGMWEPEVIHVFEKIIKPADVCLDIGANIGLLSVPLAVLAKNGHVYAFEPAMENYNYLDKNITTNGIKNVTTINSAILDTDCECTLSYIEEFGGSSFISDNADGISIFGVSGIEEKVSCIDLNRFVKENKIKNIDFIKIDVEGAEVDIIRSIGPLIRKYEPTILIEINPTALMSHFNTDAETLYTELRNLYDYMVWIKRTPGKVVVINSYDEMWDAVNYPEGCENVIVTNDYALVKDILNESTTLKVKGLRKSFKVYGTTADISSFIPLVSQNVYEPGTMKVLKKVIKPTDICIDIGGNIGMISLPLSMFAKNGHVYAFEPESDNYDNFQLSISANNITNLDVFCCGISDSREVRPLAYEPDKLACNHMTDTDFLTPGSLLKDALFITLDEFIVERNLTDINFIKIDVEGAEVKILRSIENTLKKLKPTLIVEIAPALLQTFFNDTPEDLYTIVSKIYKYIYWIDDESGELTPIKNINALNKLITKSKGWDNILCSFKEVK